MHHYMHNCTHAHTVMCTHTHWSSYIHHGKHMQTNTRHFHRHMHIHTLCHIYSHAHCPHYTGVKLYIFKHYFSNKQSPHNNTVCYLWLISISLADSESISSSLVRKASISDSSKLKCLLETNANTQLSTHSF